MIGRLTIVGVAVAAIAGFVLWQAQSDIQNYAAGTEGKAATNTAMVQVKLPETLSSNAEVGKRAFDVKCAECHGTNAAGQNGVAPPLVHKIYEPGHHGDGSFLLAAKNGVRAHHWPFGNMPPVEGITDAEVKLIVAYVRELQRANGIK